MDIIYDCYLIFIKYVIKKVIIFKKLKTMYNKNNSNILILNIYLKCS